MSAYTEDLLVDVLPLYYKRLFPSEAMYRWLSYGDESLFQRREISFTLIGDIYLRYQSFESHQNFADELLKKFPIKIDIGAIYNIKPKNRKSYGGVLLPEQKEIVFDIDMNDYDSVRTCCSGTDVCVKCWKFIVIAVKILDSCLREDFAFEHILWVFSGRRGVHCWVSDKHGRMVDDYRSIVADFMEINKGAGNRKKQVSLPDKIHSSLFRALKVIDKYFVDSIVADQDILGTDELLDNFLQLIDENVQSEFQSAMKKCQTSLDRWNAFESTFKNLLHSGQMPRKSKNLVEEIKLQYCYPRLDISVTKGFNHLLKAPFCVHPKTGRIAVPFNPKLVDNFDPNNVPTINILIDEINAYDEKTKKQEEALTETETSTPGKVRSAIKDYKKTSLLKYVTVFEEFIRHMEKARKFEPESMEVEI